LEGPFGLESARALACCDWRPRQSPGVSHENFGEGAEIDTRGACAPQMREDLVAHKMLADKLWGFECDPVFSPALCRLIWKIPIVKPGSK
jgi:hypothetical protein